MNPIGFIFLIKFLCIQPAGFNILVECRQVTNLKLGESKKTFDEAAELLKLGGSKHGHLTVH
jgi:hypothetical protein